MPMKEITLDIAGIGIIMHSPSATAHIEEGADYLEANYCTPNDVQRHIQAGSIVAFGTCTPGTFLIRVVEGYPDDLTLELAEFKLRLGLRCDGIIIFRDLYDLMDWTVEFPHGHSIELPEGIYHVTLCSHTPESGLLGDNQVIDVYFQPLDSFPALATEGIPTLCGR